MGKDSSVDQVQSGLTFKNRDNDDRSVSGRETKVVTGSPDLFQMIESGRRPVPFKAITPTREGQGGPKGNDGRGQDFLLLHCLKCGLTRRKRIP